MLKFIIIGKDLPLDYNPLLFYGAYYMVVETADEQLTWAAAGHHDIMSFSAFCF